MAPVIKLITDTTKQMDICGNKGHHLPKTRGQLLGFQKDVSHFIDLKSGPILKLVDKEGLETVGAKIDGLLSPQLITAVLQAKTKIGHSCTLRKLAVDGNKSSIFEILEVIRV